MLDWGKDLGLVQFSIAIVLSSLLISFVINLIIPSKPASYAMAIGCSIGFCLVKFIKESRKNSEE